MGEGGGGGEGGEEGGKIRLTDATIPFNSGRLCSVPLFGCFTEVIGVL